MPRVITCLAAATAGAALLAGCSSTGSGPSTTRTVKRTITHTPPHPTAPATGPIVAGPTTSADAGCPFLDVAAAADTVGVRMGRIVVLSSGGRAVGCRFYADQDPAFRASEHLPGPDQPVLQIMSSRYHDPTSAHNAMVRLAEAGANARQDDLNAATEGVSFQTRFYPVDGGRDWAYTFRRGTTVVIVQTVQTDTSFNARAVGSAIAARF